MDICSGIRAARGDEAADIVLRGGDLVNVLSGEIEPADVAIKDGLIVGVGDGYEGRTEVDVSGRYLCPGFIDPHMHLESSQVTMAQFARAVVPRGTTAVALDPHEIANVHGIAGVEYLLDSRVGVPLSVFVMAPSCVPATSMETSGAELSAAELAKLYGRPGILGLGEMMNFPGVLSCDPAVKEKLEDARRRGLVIDGHCPGLTGAELNAYIGVGIDADHECTRAEEAAEKLRRGMYVLLREASSARNLADLLPMVTAENSRRCCLCTDDRDPADLLSEGHIDDLVRKAINYGLDAMTVVRMATLNAAERLGLQRRGYGAIAPGYRADIVVCKDLESFAAQAVYQAGRLVAEAGAMVVDLPHTPASLPVSMNINWDEFGGLDVAAEAGKSRVRVIAAADAQVVTGQSVEQARIEDGFAVADTARDLLKLAVVERHKGIGNVGVGFVRGFGMKRGALASSVAHDSHNIVVVGTNDEDMLTAVRAIERAGGGQVVVADGEVAALLELPIGGLMSDQALTAVAEAGERLEAAARKLGCTLTAPFMTLSFLALPVIPSLKLTDKGLVDVQRFEIVPLWVK